MACPELADVPRGTSTGDINMGGSSAATSGKGEGAFALMAQDDGVLGELLRGRRGAPSGSAAC